MKNEKLSPKQCFISILLISSLLLPLTGCQNPYTQKNVTVLKNFDGYLMLSRDNTTNQLYLQSKNGEPQGKCGKYWYSDSASKAADAYERQEVNLNQLMDVNSLLLDNVSANAYFLHDNHYQYTVILTLCDNSVAYQGYAMS